MEQNHPSMKTAVYKTAGAKGSRPRSGRSLFGIMLVYWDCGIAVF